MRIILFNLFIISLFVTALGQKDLSINKKNIRTTAYFYRDQALHFDSLNEHQKAISYYDSSIANFLKLNFVEYPSTYAIRQSEILMSLKEPKLASEKLRLVYDSVKNNKKVYSNKYVLKLIERLGKISFKHGRIDSSMVYFSEFKKRQEKGKIEMSPSSQHILLITNERNYYDGEYKMYLKSSDELISKLIGLKNYSLALNVLQLAFTRAMVLEDKEYLHEFKSLESNLSKLYPVSYQNKFSYANIMGGYESLNNADFEGLARFVPKEDLKQLIVEKDTLGYCQLLYLQTHALLSKGKIEMAQNKIIEANNLMDQIFAEDHPAKLPYFDLLAEVNYQLSDFGNSIDILKHGLNITHKYLSENHVEEILLDFSLGKIEKSLGKTDESIAILHKADSLGHEKLPLNHLINGYIENQLGEAFLEHHEFNVSKEFLNKALKDYEDVVKEKKNVLYAKVYDDLGKVYQNTDSSSLLDIQNYLKSLEIYHLILGQKHPLLSNGYLSVSNLYFKNNNVDKALESIQKSITTNITDFDSENIHDSIPLNNIISNYYLLNSFDFKTKLLSAKAKTVKDSLIYYKTSLQTYLYLAHIIEVLRNGYVSEESKAFLSKKTFHIFEEAIDLSLKVFNATGERKYKEMAFVFSEKSRAGILLSSIKTASAKKISGVPDEILLNEVALTNDIKKYETKLMTELQKGANADSAKLTFYKENLYKSKYLYSVLEYRIEKEFPRYYKLKYEKETPSIEKFQSVLFAGEKKKKDKSQLVEYFMGSEHLYIFYLSADTFEVFKTPIDITRKYCNGMINAISFKDQRLFIKCSSYLKSKTIDPIKHLLIHKNITFVTDGELTNVPFEAFVTMGKRQKPTQKLKAKNYLIAKYRIKYGFSGLLFLQQLDDKNIEYQNNYLGVAPVFKNDAKSYILGLEKENIPHQDTSFNSNCAQMMELSETEHEIKAAYKSFKRKKKSIGLVHAFANKNLVESYMQNNYKYIHFATHAYFMPQPTLYLTCSKEGQQSLSAGEIYSLTCNTESIVLSACETGLGKMQYGEGIIGLSRSFFYAGCKSIVVSLWKVEDQSTSLFMKKYFKKLKHNNEKPHYKEKAIRKVKLSFIKSKKQRDPSKWAAFVQSGV